MKKMILILSAVLALSCSGGETNESDKRANEANSEENVDENAGENISPQLTDSADRLEVDTIRSAEGAAKQKDGNLKK